MKLHKHILTTIYDFINEQNKLSENIQLADKVYFKTGQLSEEDKKIILSITKGDNYTKLISDFFYYLKKISFNTGDLISKLKPLYNEVLNYNNNVFPIVGYDVYNSLNISEIVDGLNTRSKIVKEINKLPSISTRNMKDDIRKGRTSSELKRYFDDLEYFMNHYALLSNRDKDIKIKILRKMFKGNTTLAQLMNFVDEKANFIGGVDFTKDDVKKISESEDFEIIYEQDDVMIARVESARGIKAIGCNSLWCFTYGSSFDAAHRDWSKYSYNDMVYVLIDFKEDSDSENFMHVLIKPLTDEDDNLIEYNEDDEDNEDFPIYNMANENYTNPYLILIDLFGGNYKTIIDDYLNFEY